MYETISLVVAEPPLLNVTLVGLMLVEYPVGTGVMVKPIVPANPLRLVTVNVVVRIPLTPCSKSREKLVGVRLKSGLCA